MIRRALPAALVLLLVGCRTPPTPSWTPVDPAQREVAAALAGLQRVAAERHALRGQARVSLSDARGSSFARHLVVLARPARLRIEVMGLLGQRIAVLASDGRVYDLYRAETGRIEHGIVHPELLGEVAGVPLPPHELVDLLLGIPPRGLDRPDRAARAPGGSWELAWELAGGGEQRLGLDARGRLMSVSLRDGAGLEEVSVSYAERDQESGLARRVRFRFPGTGLRVEVAFGRVELDPELPPGLFRLQLVSSPGG